jgi:integrase
MRRGVKIPAYRHHSASGQAVVTVPGGGGAVVYLGPFNSPESRARYAETVAAWLQGKSTPAPVPMLAPGSRSFTVGRLALEYFEHAQQYYRDPQGKETKQVYTERRAMRLLVEAFEAVECEAFGPRKLVEFQQSLAGRGLSRTTVAEYVGAVKRAFRWAVLQERIPGGVMHSLREVPNLKAGRSAAKEPKRVQPVPVEVVEKTLPHLSPVLADVVRVLLLTGARPGEVLGMRWGEIDRSGGVWIFKPAQHKTAYRGHSRQIAIGPKAQEVLGKYLNRSPDAFLFSPREAVEQMRARRRAERKTPVWASHAARYAKQKRKKPKRAPGERYHPNQLGKAIARACQTAGVPGWHPHQCRHTAATEIRRRFGLEAAQVVLGHESPDVTLIYAEKHAAAAVEVMKEIG